MPGTKIGGLKAAATNKRLHGEDFYANIGRKGGKNGHTGGFAANPELAKAAGRKGGKISRRRPKTLQQSIDEMREKLADPEVQKALNDLLDFEEDKKYIKKINY